jgi:hypothetical protein
MGLKPRSLAAYPICIRLKSFKEYKDLKGGLRSQTSNFTKARRLEIMASRKGVGG